MIRPDAIPLIEAASRVTLPPASVEALFGKGYRLRGGERVKLGSEVSLQVHAGNKALVVLDRMDRSATGTGPLRLIGPRGVLDVPPAGLLTRRLVLPAGVRRAWRLEPAQPVALAADSLIWTNVVVAEGPAAGAVLDRVDLLAAGLNPGDFVVLRRDVPASEPAGEATPPPKRLITENDVRQARLHGKRIAVQPGQIITPAARSLGKELGVLDWPSS